jgi:hypothetical protein
MLSTRILSWGLERVICMMDDILVYGKNAEQHWGRLKAVLSRISIGGMTLKKEKCQFGVKSVKFLGHVVSGDGIKPDPDKVETTKCMNPPTNKIEVRRFMGMVNYLSKFSSNLSDLASPIYAIMGQNQNGIGA